MIIIGLFLITGFFCYLIIEEEIRLMSGYKAEYERLVAECEARSPEGSYCLIDYYPINYFTFLLFPLILWLWGLFYITFMIKLPGEKTRGEK